MITEVTLTKMAKPASQVHIELVSIILWLVMSHKSYGKALTIIILSPSSQYHSYHTLFLPIHVLTVDVSRQLCIATIR